MNQNSVTLHLDLDLLNYNQNNQNALNYQNDNANYGNITNAGLCIIHYLSDFGIEKIWKKTIKNMLDHGWDINKKLRPGNICILMMAVQVNNIKLAKFLINEKADLENKDFHHTTPLLLASEKGYLDMVQLLLEKKANVNSIDKNNDSSLTLASFKNNLKIVKLLVENNADIKQKNFLKKNAIDFSIENGINIENVEKLYSTKIKIENKQINENCLICLDKIEKKSLYFTCNICKKKFHRKCVTHWFILKKCKYDKTCPYCKNICLLKINRNLIGNEVQPVMKP